MKVSMKTVIGFMLICLGIFGTEIAILYESIIMGFIGPTLLLWGCLLLLALPGKYISSEIMEYYNFSTFLALDQIITSSNLKGKAIYMPLLKKSNPSQNLEIKNEFIYIPKNIGDNEINVINGYDHKSEGLRFSPPGQSLLDLIEKKANINFSVLIVEDVIELLPSILTDKLEICDKFEIFFDLNEVKIKINKPICENMCFEISSMKNICPNIGCPLVSSVACILIRVLKKPMVISECSINNGIIEILYLIKII